jgi:IclR family transcriptional regulator, KDG regulon repressor
MKDNRTVNRVLAILELIAKHEEGLTLGEIYPKLDIPKATCYDFLQTLYKADAVYYKDPRLKNYVIGSKMFAIGSVYTKNSSFIESAEHELKDFAMKTGFTVFGTKRINDKIVYVHKYQPKNSKVMTPQEIGTATHDFTNSVVGQCYLSFDQKVLDRNLPDFDENRRKRYLFANDRNSPHIVTLAAPVYNFENRVVGVIAACDLASIETDREALAEEFVSISENISRKLGFIADFSSL